MWQYGFLFFLTAYLALVNLRPVYLANPWVRLSSNWHYMFVLLVLLVGLRHQVGGDWGNYLGNFNASKDLPLALALLRGDPAYQLLSWLAVQLNQGVYFIDTVCALIFTWGLVVFCRNTAMPWLAMAVAVPYLVVVVAMGYTRQGVAIGLAMLALVALDKDRVLSFVFWLALGAAFHKSAVILLPLAIFHRTKRPWLEWTLVAGSTFVLYTQFLQSSVEALTSNYVDAGYQSSGAAIRVGMNALPAVVFLLLRNRFVLLPAQRDFWYWMSLSALGLVAALVVSPSSTAVDRVALYWIPLQLFVWSHLPVALGQDGKASKQWVQYIVIYSGAVLLVWLLFATHAKYWLPYKFYPWEWFFGTVV